MPADIPIQARRRIQKPVLFIDCLLEGVFSQTMWLFGVLIAAIIPFYMFSVKLKICNHVFFYRFEKGPRM
ncbi:MAG TPA: hypothetical protein DCR11_08625 [Deltaproteobacteria bacterium]|nr:hypothetical protein [Deltaproteobacteria bacterium]